MTDILGSNNEVTPIFGLTRSQLRPIVVNIAHGEPVTSFHIDIDHQVQGFYGYSADKIIPTFTYTTQSGRSGKTTAFVKRFHRTGPAEAHHYIHLQEYQAPIPRLYGFLADTDGREILFLEYLEPIGDIQACEKFVNDLNSFRHCLEATAHFNAIHPVGDYAAQLQKKDVIQGLNNSIATLESLWDHAFKNNLGDALKYLCLRAQNGLPQLQILAKNLIEPVAEMEIGLIHSDLYPENTGWRRRNRELLILDLEWIGFGPRFYDTARWLGAPEDIQPHYNQRYEMAYCYMEQYACRGGRTTALDQFMKENRVLWMTQKISMLWFGLARALDGFVDWTEDHGEGKRFFREHLYRDLHMLLREIVKK